MKRTRFLFLIGCFGLFSAAGCGAPDGLDDNDADDPGEAEQADTVSSTSTYYSVRQDLRRCVFPVCGGLWVKRLNFSTTKCVDGRWASECYVAETDYSALGLSEDEVGEFRGALVSGHAVVRGRIAAKTYAGMGTFGNLVAREGWRAATDQAPTGTFYRVTDNGIRCFTLPCFSNHEAKLNSTISTDLSSVNLTPSGASQDQIAAGFKELQASGILAAGTNVRIMRAGPAGTGKELVASQFYTRVVHQGPMACGGFIGTACPKGQYCDITVAGACGGADLPGVCVTPADFCIDLYKPVCGCDGQTYSNDCFRQAAQAQLDHDGECAAPKDCRSTGCARGQYCTFCWVNYACIPEGAVC